MLRRQPFEYQAVDKLQPGARLDATGAYRRAEPILVLAADFGTVIGFLELEYSHASHVATASV